MLGNPALTRKNRQLAWVLAAVALLFFIGFMLRIWLTHG